MQRYFINQLLSIDDSVKLSPDDNHHLVNVMRSQIGDEIVLIDSHQTPYLAKIRDIVTKVAEITVLEEEQSIAKEMPVEVIIACGISKQDKVDYIIQKATECGMAEFVPLTLKRDVVKLSDTKAQKRLDRWQKIAKEAAQQSRRTRIPDIHQIMSLEQLIMNISYDYGLIAYEESIAMPSNPFVNVLNNLRDGQRLVMVFGSEGGITQEEVDYLQKNKFISCHLGPRILRAETAPIYALSAISYAKELQTRK